MDKEESLHRQLYDLEERLLQPEVRHSESVLASLLADEFVEFGSSGQACDKRSIIESLATEQPVRISISQFKALPLAPGLALVTYQAAAISSEGGPVKHSLRSSVWKLTSGRWRMVFHQGTPISAP